MLEIRIICLIFGALICLVAAFMLPAFIASFLYDTNEVVAFFLSIIFSMAIGGLLIIIGTKRSPNIGVREGFIIVAGAPAVMSIFTAFPFILSQTDIALTDTFFEAVSGITGTGATVFNNLESLPRDILLWRSTTQWISGLGYAILAVMILPMLKIGGLQLLRIEFGDRTEKMVIRAVNLGAWIFALYILFTILCFLLYAANDMTGFDALNHALTTVSSGGFSTHDESFGYFSENINLMVIAIVFMILSALPFPLLVQFFKGNCGPVVRDTQVRYYLTTLIAICMIMLFWLWKSGQIGSKEEIVSDIFNISAIFTGTGYAIGDYSLWGSFPFIVFFFLMMHGGCTGSTAGGLKAYRIVIFFKGLGLYFNNVINPNRVFIPRFNQQKIPSNIIFDVSVYLVIFAITIAFFAAILAALNLDAVSALSTSVAAVTNLGPALGPVVGPAANYSSLSDAAKWVMVFAMLTGRLEIVTFLILFTKEFWKD